MFSEGEVGKPIVVLYTFIKTPVRLLAKIPFMVRSTCNESIRNYEGKFVFLDKSEMIKSGPFSIFHKIALLF